jgi:hypothetical protein
VYASDNDCGGTNFRSFSVGERGWEYLRSYDGDQHWRGTRWFTTEDGSEIHDCEQGGLGAGQLLGTLCRSIGPEHPLCQ